MLVLSSHSVGSRNQTQVIGLGQYPFSPSELHGWSKLHLRDDRSLPLKTLCGVGLLGNLESEDVPKNPVPIFLL